MFLLSATAIISSGVSLNLAMYCHRGFAPATAAFQTLYQHLREAGQDPVTNISLTILSSSDQMEYGRYGMVVVQKQKRYSEK